MAPKLKYLTVFVPCSFVTLVLHVGASRLPPGTYVLDLWLSVLCMRSKTWLAARMSLRLGRLPRTASGAQRSRRRRSTRAAAPVLLAHADVTKSIKYF